MKVLVKNNLGVDIRLEDFQIVVPKKEIIELTYILPLMTILTDNFDLRNLISNKNVSINDGNRDLSIEEALNYISLDYWNEKLNKINELGIKEYKQ